MALRMFLAASRTPWVLFVLLWSGFLLKWDQMLILWRKIVASFKRKTLKIQIPPLAWLNCNDYEISRRQRYLKAECFKLLLANNADASLAMDVGHESSSQFSAELHVCSLAALRALLDLGGPFISPNSTGADHIELSPLLILASSYNVDLSEDSEIPDKVALLLARRADASQTDSLGNSCLHIVTSWRQNNVSDKSRLDSQAELKDILMLMITAGADVYAVNGDDDTVSEIAHLYGHGQIWAEALEACGYDEDTFHQGTNIALGRSSAVDISHTKRSAEWTSKLSFADYLKQRKALYRVTEIFDYEDAEREQVQEEYQNLTYCDTHPREGSVWDWNAGSATGRDFYGEGSSEEGNDNEEMWN